MKKAKPEHRRDYWKYHVAAYSFEHAQKLASRLLRMSDSDALFYPLMVSLHVLYGRPFRHSKRARNIEDNLIPTDLREVHNLLLQMRDRIFAHHDTESRITDMNTGVDYFQLVVAIKDGIMHPAVQLVFPTTSRMDKVQRLCEHLYRECMSLANATLEKCIAGVPSDGVYRVSTVFEGRAPLLIRSELSTEQSRGHLKETQTRPKA